MQRGARVNMCGCEKCVVLDREGNGRLKEERLVSCPERRAIVGTVVGLRG